MEYRLGEGFSEKKGVISNTHGFLQTYMDGGFKEKWSGYWSPGQKYLDYFATKVNGVWLTGETLEEACYGDKIVYTHKVSSLKIKQKISCPANTAGFKVEWIVENNSEENKAVRISLETGIDIRSKEEDIGSQDYSLETIENGKKIINGQNSISIIGKKFNFDEGVHSKEHFPGEKQICLIPGEIYCQHEVNSGNVEKAEITFKTDGKVEEKTESPKGSLRHEELGRTFNYSIKSLENLYYGKNGRGVIAGHPWFQNYWARDSFWTSLGMIDAGMFEEVEKLLLNFAERENFPSKIRSSGGSETDYPRSDSIPLYIIAVDQLNKYYSADEKLIERAEELLNERPRGKIVENHPDGTWMDTLEREKAVDIQSLWIEALERFNRGTKRLRKGLEEFKKEDYIKDNLENNFESINPAIPIMFGQVEEPEAENYLEKINGEFSSHYGARTRSVTDPGYDSSGYHTGSVWGLTTCWAAAANLEYNQKNHGMNFLKKLSHFIDRNQLGALPEVANAENGESLGCDEQAWSAGLFIHVIDSYLLGISFEDDRLIIDPADGISLVRKGKRIGDERIDIKVNNGKAKVVNNPDVKFETR